MQSLPSYVVSALSRLEETGAEAYVVGGAVRDALRDAPVHDYDITTSATPEEVLIAFAGERTVETGLKHGTVTVLLEGVPLEITTFRIDGGYHDGRHPDSVTFTRSLREDSARRDFTVNAMASDKAGRIYDFFGGKEDLKAGVIRTVGDPLLRFKEDALRILRALRFASTLDFRIEERTLCAARLLKEDLKRISPERIREELIKLLTGKAAARVLREGREVLSSVLPEILPTFGFDQRNPHHAFDLWEHTVRTVDAVLPVPHLRLAALLHDLGKPSCFKEDENGVGHFYGHAEKSERIAEGILSRLRFDNKTRHTVLLLVKQHDVLPQPATRQFARMRSRYSDEFLFDWLALIRADRTAQTPVLSPEKDAVLREAEDAAAALLQKEERLDLHSLAIGGEDLFRCGVPRGKEMGILLQRALAAVLDGAVKNEKEALLSYLSLTPIECERKLLIRFPSLSVLCELGAEESEIEQTYLLSEEGVTERVRRRVYKDGTLYFYTKKIRINALSAKEYERELSKAEYDGLLSRRDRTRTPILKRRFVLPYEGHLLEIDVYPFWTRQAILEVELSSETEGFSLPPFIEVLRDVTADKAYKNQMLARRIPPEEGEK